MAIEIPQYTVLKKEKKFEQRQYKGYIKAEVTIKNESYDKASREGFRIIADFIFGNNTKRQKISMTAPVMQNIKPSEIIAMTAPVNVNLLSNNTYNISFIMPSKYSLKTLPIPNNKKINIIEVESFKAAVLSFSGFVNKGIITIKKVELENWIKNENLISTGEIDIARYNPPWTPWFLRRNEIVMHIKN
jgi:hypothetical protein